MLNPAVLSEDKLALTEKDHAFLKMFFEEERQPLQISRRERREMKREAKKANDMEILDCLDRYESNLAENHGSAAHIQILPPRSFDKLEEEHPDLSQKLLYENARMVEKQSALSEKLTNSVTDLIDTMHEEQDEFNKKRYSIEAENERLKYENARLKDGLWQADDDEQVRLRLLDYLVADDKSSLTVTDCLLIIERLSGDVVILPSAWDSAAEADKYFRDTPRLLRLLAKLVHSWFWAITIDGKSDAEARKVFSSSEYAAGESGGLEASNLGKLRTFIYNGKEVKAFRHLRIGVANDRSHTIRVYFAWDAEEEKIIIAYCGEHLPTIKTKH